VRELLKCFYRAEQEEKEHLQGGLYVEEKTKVTLEDFEG
jgi:hypothetical protein